MILIKFVYFDYGGSHSSVLAANIHLGNLNSAKTPSDAELINLPLFDKTVPEDFGTMQYVGQDENNHEVYVFGTRHSDFTATINGLAALLGVSTEYTFVGTMPYVNYLLRLGGFLSRGLSAPSLGRPFVFRGAKMAYPALANLVDRVKVETI
ncbi:MAG TPA: DUF3189 family protein [Syntrophomonadaceae bacterium]|nr:DUF3189 family protein [Syntrophomonadaceae bacterium]